MNEPITVTPDQVRRAVLKALPDMLDKGAIADGVLFFLTSELRTTDDRRHDHG